MQVSSVDFRRIWMDRSTRDPTREGISLWRPVPPPGYFAVGVLLSPCALSGLTSPAVSRMDCSEVSSGTTMGYAPGCCVRMGRYACLLCAEALPPHHGSELYCLGS